MKTELRAMLEKYEAILKRLDMEQKKNGRIEGRVEVSRKMPSGYNYVYTCRDPLTGKRIRKHVSAENNSIVYALAQQTYREKVRRLMELRIPQIKALLKDYEDDELERLYTELHPGRRAIVKPIESTRAQRMQYWRNISYEGLRTMSQEVYFETNQGEMVRSKSEKILADKFFALGIPYKYECPLTTKNRTTLYPDFTFYDPQNDREIYWEHFGMMGDPAYAKKAYQKLEEYAKRGIYLGDRLIATFEMSDKPLNMEYVKHMIGHHLRGLQDI